MRQHKSLPTPTPRLAAPRRKGGIERTGGHPVHKVRIGRFYELLESIEKMEEFAEAGENGDDATSKTSFTISPTAAGSRRRICLYHPNGSEDSPILYVTSNHRPTTHASSLSNLLIGAAFPLEPNSCRCFWYRHTHDAVRLELRRRIVDFG